MLFDDLEQKERLIGLLDDVGEAQGVRIFIGAETRLFSLSGSAVIAAPYMTGRQKVVGAIGVIGPARLNYARIIPLVDYTARVLGRMLGRLKTGAPEQGPICGFGDGMSDVNEDDMMDGLGARGHRARRHGAGDRGR